MEKGGKKAMLAIRGVYDGKTFRALENEVIPDIEGEVPVALLFLGETSEIVKARREMAARNLRALRDRMEPLGCSVKDLIEEGRER